MSPWALYNFKINSDNKAQCHETALLTLLVAIAESILSFDPRLESPSSGCCCVLVPLLSRERPTQHSENYTSRVLRHISALKGKESGPEIRKVAPEAVPYARFLGYTYNL